MANREFINVTHLLVFSLTLALSAFFLPTFSLQLFKAESTQLSNACLTRCGETGPHYKSMRLPTVCNVCQHKRLGPLLVDGWISLASIGTEVCVPVIGCSLRVFKVSTGVAPSTECLWCQNTSGVQVKTLLFCSWLCC